MDGAIFALVAPMVMAEFAVGLSEYRSGVQIAMLVGIVGLYLWPWLADRYGRRNLLAINIAMFSLMMPLVALAPSRSEEHTSELQSLMRISYAVFCLKKKNTIKRTHMHI